MGGVHREAHRKLHSERQQRTAWKSTESRAFSLTSKVALSKLLNFSGFSCLHWKKGDDSNTSFHGVLQRVNE